MMSSKLFKLEWILTYTINSKIPLKLSVKKTNKQTNKKTQCDKTAQIPLWTELLQWGRQMALKTNCQRHSLSQRTSFTASEVSPDCQKQLNVHAVRVTSLNFELWSQLAFDFLQDNSIILHIANRSLAIFPQTLFIIHLSWFEPPLKISIYLNSLLLQSRCWQRGAWPFQLSAYHFHEFFLPGLL